MAHCGAHLAGITGPGGGKRGLFFAWIIWSRGTACSGEEKADWLHILSAFVSVGPLFPLPSIEGRDFPLSLISTVEHHGGGE